MKATGTNTAQMAKVVAITASPISEVPSCAAVTWSLPMPRWRTMFSRTTMASSISKPMHRLSAIMVMKLSVKPRAFTAMKDAITEMGKVNPVMTVLRHECKNKNTITTVSAAPSISVRFTPSSEALTESLVALVSFNSTPAGKLLLSSSPAFFKASPVCTTLASCILKTSNPMALTPSTRDMVVGSCSRSVMVPRSASVSTTGPRRATTTLANCLGSRTRPSTRTVASCLALLSKPTGKSALASRSAVAISLGVTA